MHSLGRLSTFLLSLSSSGNNKYNFKDLSLQIALESYQEGDNFVSEGKYQDACMAYMEGVLVGRRSVQKLVQKKDDSVGDNGGNEDDSPDMALDWLVSSYLKCSKARMEMKDWESARADAWAACSYTQNTSLEPLTYMLSICEQTEDQIGEIQTLKSILALVAAAPSGELDGFAKPDLEKRITDLDDELMKKMRGK